MIITREPLHLDLPQIMIGELGRTSGMKWVDFYNKIFVSIQSWVPMLGIILELGTSRCPSYQMAIKF